MRWALAAAVCACIVPPTLSAQNYDEGEVHGAYSYLNFDTNGVTPRQSANGWEAGASANLNKWVGIEFSSSGYYTTYTTPPGIDITFRDYSLAAGPKVNFKSLFVHALLGGDLAKASALGSSGTQNGFGGAFGGGVQRKISGPWAVRLSADYVFTRHKLMFGGPAYLQNNYRLSAGIAYVFSGHTEEELTPSNGAVSMPVFGLSVVTTAGNKGAEIVDITPGGVAERGGLRRGDVITSVNTQDVRSPIDLAVALRGLSGEVQIGYSVKTSASDWMLKVTTVVFGKQD